MHSEKFEKVKFYYDTKRWNLDMVRNSVTKNWITEDEFKEITGQDF